jgi:hypothetical protein
MLQAPKGSKRTRLARAVAKLIQVNVEHFPSNELATIGTLLSRFAALIFVSHREVRIRLRIAVWAGPNAIITPCAVTINHRPFASVQAPLRVFVIQGYKAALHILSRTLGFVHRQFLSLTFPIAPVRTPHYDARTRHRMLLHLTKRQEFSAPSHVALDGSPIALSQVTEKGILCKVLAAKIDTRLGLFPPRLFVRLKREKTSSPHEHALSIVYVPHG